MQDSLKQTEVRPMDDTAETFTGIYERTMPSLYRLCFSYLKNRADTQDTVHNAYLRLMKRGTAFESDEHCKAWLFVTARNLCKNHLRHWWRSRRADSGGDGELFSLFEAQAQTPEVIGDVRDAVLNLPDKYKTLVFLYYYEGYDSGEIADMLKKNSSTVRRQLAEARAILGGIIGEE